MSCSLFWSFLAQSPVSWNLIICEGHSWSYLVLSHFIMKQRITLPGSSCHYIPMNPFCRDSGDKLPVSNFDILVCHFYWTLCEGAKWNPYLLLGPAQVQGAMDNQQVAISSHHFWKHLAPQIECFFGLGFILLDILEIGAVDCNKQLPKSWN